MPHFDIETRYAPARVCGVDEAGRGPWAGPVVAAAVMFCPNAIAIFMRTASATHKPSPLAGEGRAKRGVRGCAEDKALFNAPPSNLPPQVGEAFPASSSCSYSTPCRAHEIPSGLNDSKQLSRRARDACYDALMDANIAHGIGVATAEEIDALNIWGATQLAMRRAVEALPTAPDIALVDGKVHPKPFMCPTHTLIGGDGVSLSIAAASILAKVTRDRLMDALAEQYPLYGFESHAGYGTKQHREALALHGPCPAHRRSYAPIRALLETVAA